MQVGSWMHAYNHLTSEAGRKVLVNGWKAAGNTKATSKGLIALETLDPFDSIDPLVQSSDEIIDQSEWEMNLDQRDFFATIPDDDE